MVDGQHRVTAVLDLLNQGIKVANLLYDDEGVWMHVTVLRKSLDINDISLISIGMHDTLNFNQCYHESEIIKYSQWHTYSRRYHAVFML